MRVLVVGAGGMLGADLVEAFRGAGHEAIGLTRADLDITDPGSCASRIEEWAPDVVLNAAALTAVDYCEDHEEEALRVNADGAGYLAGAAHAAGSSFAHFSTDYVFDGEKRSPYLEEDVPNPRSVYGRSKREGEEQVRAATPMHLILRTSWVFGRNGRNFVRTIARAARSGEHLRVVDDQRGSPSYTRDLAAHTVRLVEAGCRGTYHLTNRGACSWYELAAHILRCLALDASRLTPVSTAEFPRPAPRPANSVLANARLEREGFPLMRPWQEAVREYLEEGSIWEAG